MAAHTIRTLPSASHPKAAAERAYEWVKGAAAERNAELEADETILRSTDLGPATS